VVRVYPEGGQRRSEYTFQNGALLQEWHGDDGSGILVRYGSKGRESARESWEGELLVTRQSYQYRDSGVLERSVIVNYEDDTRIEISYNDDGQPIREEHRSGGELVATTEFAYEKGLLALRREDTEAGIVERRYEYDEDGEISQEELYRDGRIVTRITYPEPGQTVEERFRDGEPFLRIYFRDGRRVREEVLHQGTVIQERSFE
jgi:antitoxin component YwqK of YwqJK toxin-antitoxin module